MLIHRAGQVLLEEGADVELDDDEESKKEEGGDGEEDDDRRWVHLIQRQGRLGRDDFNFSS